MGVRRWMTFITGLRDRLEEGFQDK